MIKEKQHYYLFQFAIENSKVINGYITEKIFDAFFQTVFLYSGTKSISNYIPNDTYINIDDFDSFDHLFDFTENLSKNIMNYKLARDNFFKSKNIELFDIKYNSKILVDNILKDLNLKIMSKPKAIILSGYFNPIHKGHLDYFNNAKAKADKLFVIVNNDLQRQLKGSKEFQDENERMVIVSNIKAVDKAILSVDSDRSVCKPS